MPNLTFSLTYTPRVVNGVAGQHKYQATIPNPKADEDEEPDTITNPETKEQFVVQVAKDNAKNATKSFESISGSEIERKRLLRKAEDEINV